MRPRCNANLLACIAVTLLLILEYCTASGEAVTCSGIVPMRYRNDKISITDFGGVGDGRTLNTKAFNEAIYRIKHLRRRGGTLLYIPSGVYLTESFNLTSRMTLFLAKGAVIKATQNTANWPLIAPLPSYGRGRERPGGRYMSFIHGEGLHDVIITGEKGTIDGQGGVWWNMWRQRTLKLTRPNLIEFKDSRNIIISNVVFKNSPFWNIHPVYCRNVVIRHVTILAPPDSPNTDGIDPDSSSHVCIEDSYISTGDDLVAVKSGWDEYGIAYARPSHDITIRRVTGSSKFAGIAVGSETSGGVYNILAEDITLYNMGFGIHLKTNVGRGGIIRNITISDVYMVNVRKGIKIAADVGDHPDNNYNPNALPVLKHVRIRNIRGIKVQQAGLIIGLKNSPFTDICLSNINLRGTTGSKYIPWKCSDVSGGSIQVKPSPCSELIRGTGTCSGAQSIQNAFNGTKLYMNPNFPEVTSFAERLASQGCGPITVAHIPPSQSQSTYSTKTDFINGEVINLDEISAHLKVATYVTLATINSLHVEEAWWYLACRKCKNKVVPLTEHDQVNPADFPNGLKCKGCYPKPPPSLGPSYKLQVRVINDTRSASFTLFDRDVMKLIKISCYDLRNKYVDDEFAFPEELNQLIGKTLLFMVSVSAYNKEKNYQVYTVDMFTDDEDIINNFKKAHAIDQDGVDEDTLTHSVDGPPQINMSSKDAISCTGENISSVDLTLDTAESPSGKRTFEAINDGSTSAKSSSSKTKKRLLEVNINN